MLIFCACSRRQKGFPSFLFIYITYALRIVLGAAVFARALVVCAAAIGRERGLLDGYLRQKLVLAFLFIQITQKSRSNIYAHNYEKMTKC